MKNRLKYIIITSVCAISTYSIAQDVHFSQMSYAPLNINPALAGANSALQAIVNYRSQWNSVAEPYQTIGASIDARFNENKRDRKGIIAGGLNFFSDRAGDLKVSTTIVNLNLVYHLILDKKSTLGLGIYSGFGQRAIDPTGGRWGSQYNGSTYDEAIPSNEVFNSPSFSYLDAGAGLLYAFKKNEGYMTQNNQRQCNAGVAAFHVNNPSYSFIDNASEKLYMRWSVFVNGTLGVKNSNGAFLPGIYFNLQKSNMEILYGTYYRITLAEGSKITGFNKQSFLHIGLFHRWEDAIVGKAMLEWSDISAGFAYDINISSLNEVSNARGGFEIFLRYNLISTNGSLSRIR